MLVVVQVSNVGTPKTIRIINYINTELKDKIMKIIIKHEFNEERNFTFLILTAYFNGRKWTRKYWSRTLEDAKKHFKKLIINTNN